MALDRRLRASGVPLQRPVDVPPARVRVPHAVGGAHIGLVTEVDEKGGAPPVRGRPQHADGDFPGPLSARVWAGSAPNPRRTATTTAAPARLADSGKRFRLRFTATSETLARMVGAVNVFNRLVPLPTAILTIESRTGISSSTAGWAGDWDRARPGVPAADGGALRAARRARCERNLLPPRDDRRRYPEWRARSRPWPRGRLARVRAPARLRQGADEFRADVQRSVDAIGEADGRTARRLPRPGVLDQPRHAVGLRGAGRARVPLRLEPARNRRDPEPDQPDPGSPYRIELPSGGSLWELPTRVGRGACLSAAARYWRPLPAAPVIVRALRDHVVAGPLFPSVRVRPATLRAELPDGLGTKQRTSPRAVLRNPGRGLIAARLRRVAQAVPIDQLRGGP